MIKSMTRGELYAIEQGIIQIQKTDPTLSLLLSKEINLFSQRAALHLKAMHSRIQGIKEKYVQKDVHGNFITVKVDENTNAWKFIESKTDLMSAEVLDVSQVQERFTNEIDALFNQTIQFDW